MYLPNILGMEQHRPEGFLEKLVEPLKPSGRFPCFLRRYKFYSAQWRPSSFC